MQKKYNNKDLNIYFCNEYKKPYFYLNKTINMAKGKSLAGRKLIFKEPQLLQDRINEYFEYCDIRTKKEIVKNKEGYEIVDMPDQIPYTVYGLADFLDVDADTLLNYQERPDYSVLIARAKHKILTNKVERGLDGKSNPSMTKLMLGHCYGIIEPKSEIENEKEIRIIIEDRTD